MVKQESDQQEQIRKGMVERTYALTLDFSVEEIGLLQNKLRDRKSFLLRNSKKGNRDTIQL